MKFQKVILLTAVFLAAAHATAQDIKLNVAVTPKPEMKLHVKGTVTCTTLYPKGQRGVSNDVSVSIEWIEGGGKFRTLPEWCRIRPYGMMVGKRALTKDEVNGVKSSMIPVYRARLGNGDEGKAHSFDRTVTLPAKAAQYRVVASLDHQWSGTWPAIIYRHQTTGGAKPGQGTGTGSTGGGGTGTGGTNSGGTGNTGGGGQKPPTFTWSTDTKTRPFDILPPPNTEPGEFGKRQEIIDLDPGDPPDLHEDGPILTFLKNIYRMIDPSDDIARAQALMRKINAEIKKGGLSPKRRQQLKRYQYQLAGIIVSGRIMQAGMTPIDKVAGYVPGVSTVYNIGVGTVKFFVGKLKGAGSRFIAAIPYKHIGTIWSACNDVMTVSDMLPNVKTYSVGGKPTYFWPTHYKSHNSGGF